MSHDFRRQFKDSRFHGRIFTPKSILLIVLGILVVLALFSMSSNPTQSVWTNIEADVTALVTELGCHPILVRLAWHDAGTYDKRHGNGGPHAAMRHPNGESTHSSNAGLHIARDLLQPIKDKYPSVSTADFWQFAALVAIHAAGGPKIPFRSGRTDADVAAPSIAAGRLPDATQGSDHLRAVFTIQLGFDDQEIVALSGAHALGRAHKERSGFEGPWTDTPLKFSNSYYVVLLERHWHEKEESVPLQYEDTESKKLMMLPTDLVLIKDKSFLPHVESYAKDQQLFFDDFSKAFKKLSELGYSESDLSVVEW